MADDLHTTSEARANSDNGIPPGWNYNPATWGQRLPIVVLALIGGAIAFYLTLFQWDVVDNIWDPFFNGGPEHANGSAKILKSPTSEFLPFPFTDGFLGFLGYVGDAVTGIIGGTRRWRRMPWIVIVFGILVGPLGAVSLGLVMTQPLAYSTFCTLCCVTAVISVLMIGPAMDEMLASLQYMKRVREHGLPFWRYFFGLGDQQPLTERPPTLARTTDGDNWNIIGVQWVVAGIGVYVLFASDLWGFGGWPQTVGRVIGPLVIAAAIVAGWEATRNVRLANLPLGVALVALPPLLGAPIAAIVSSAVAGLLIAALSLLPYRPTQTFGGGWPRVWRDLSVTTTST